MPVIKSAKKKLRQDKKRQEQNKVFKDNLKKVIKEFRKSPSEKSLQTVYSATDKAVKKQLIHKNKAARVKSSLTKLIQKDTAHAAPVKKVAPRTTKKAPVKKKK